MPDRYVGVLLKNGQKKSVEAYNTESPFLCIAPANDEVRWTIVFDKTGATFGAFSKFNDANNTVRILMQYGLDRADSLVRGKEWEKYPQVTPELKQWILEVSRANRK